MVTLQTLGPGRIGMTQDSKELFPKDLDDALWIAYLWANEEF